MLGGRLLLPVQKGDPFYYHEPTDELRAHLKQWRAYFRQFRDQIVREVPEGRQRALAITHLEDALMHTISALVIDGTESEPRDDR